MKDLSLNISFQQCHSKQHVPSSPKGYPDGYRERWGLISGAWRFFAALRSALNDGIRCIVLSNKQIAPRNDGNYEDLLKWN